MNIHNALTVSAIAVVLAMPGFASATSLWHDAGGEAGATFHPDHIKSTRTRADALQDLEVVRNDGSLWYLQRGLAVPVNNAGTERTREEVRNEVLSMTVDERRQFQMIGSR